MAVLGIGVSKFTGTGSPDSSTVTLDTSEVFPSWGESDVIEQKSVVNGDITFVPLGCYASFTVIVNLFKYISPTPATKFNTLMSYLHKNVVFYPHKDGVTAGDGLGKSVMDSSSAAVNCFVESIIPEYVDNATFPLKLKMVFRATKYVDITKTVQ